MPMVSLKTASALTGLSKRTLWRRIAAGQIFKQTGNGAAGITRVALEAILEDIGLSLSEQDLALVERADRGDPVAETDLALLLLEGGGDTRAIHWLRSAASRGYGDAMQLLGTCYVAGRGVERDEAQGLAWIGQAAAQGHAIARMQMQGLSRRA